MQTYKDRVAAITGAGSGMGRALALELAARGCHLALSDVSADTLAETERLLAEYPVTVTATTLDVADRDAVFAFARDTRQAHGRVHMVFNNAGVALTDTVEHMRFDDFEWLMNINFWGVVNGTKAFLPYLKEVEEAHIANTASIFGVITIPTQSAYHAAKFAVRGFTESLRQELAETPIGVSCILPGGVRTNIVRTSRYYATDNEAPTKDEAAALFESFAGLSSEEATRIILAGVSRNRAHILVGRDARFLSALQRLLPQSYPKVILRLAERNRRRRAAAQS
ncbi:MAG: SDR family oxidoreductase [Pseudomonadota bacterium]